MLSFWVFSVRVCVLFIYIILMSFACVWREELILIESNQHIYDFNKRLNFKKQIHSRKLFFDISELFIYCNTHSCCEHIIGGVKIDLYECVSLLTPECAVCLCLCVCVISNQSTSKKLHYVSDLGKLDTLLNKTQSKVLLVQRYQGSTCVDIQYHQVK